MALKREHIENPRYSYVESCHFSGKHREMYDIVAYERDYPDDGMVGVAICNNLADAVLVANALNESAEKKESTSASV